MTRIILSLIVTLCTVNIAQAQEVEPSMTLKRFDDIIRSLDKSYETNGYAFQMTVQDVPVLILTDNDNDRMRVMVPIRAVQEMTKDDVLRVMQANFDTALDARYAIAQGKLWGTFIHPFASLEKNEFISGLGQTVNLAITYGTLFSGGALSFGGGDSVPLQRQLIDDLLKKGKEI